MPSPSLKVNRITEKQQKRGRGRPSAAKVGDIDSLIEQIHFYENKFEVDVVNNLGKMYDMMKKMALKEGEYSKIGIKDQVKAIEYCIKRAESFLDDYYAEKEGGKAEKVVEEKPKDEGFPQLISMNFGE